MTSSLRVAVASRSFSSNPILRSELLDRFPHATFNDLGASLRGESLLSFLDGHDAAITALEPINEELLQALPDLRIVSKYGVGIDMLDLAAFNTRGIRLGWSGGVNKRSVSELVIAFAINMFRHLPAANSEVKDGTWRQLKGRQLTGKTVGIVGCGRVGRDLSILLKTFDCRILAFDKRNYASFYETHGIKTVGLEELLSVSDVVTLHIPLDSSTENILNAGRLALMKHDAILINAARGGLVDEVAVKRFLSDGKLAAAAFDVFTQEPPVDKELITLPNFFATPHLGGSSVEAILNMGRAAIAGLTDNAVPDPGGEFQNLKTNE